MKLTNRQEQILSIVRRDAPVSGDKISEDIGLSKAALRPDLSFLTMAGILKATPKIGYSYAGKSLDPFFFEKIFHAKVTDIMVPPTTIAQNTTIQEAITNLFIFDVGSLIVVDEEKKLLGVLSRKDLLRAALSNDLRECPVVMTMTRIPHVKRCTTYQTILEVTSILHDFEVDSLPVLNSLDDFTVVGKITKTLLLNFIIERAREANALL